MFESKEHIEQLLQSYSDEIANTVTSIRKQQRLEIAVVLLEKVMPDVFSGLMNMPQKGATEDDITEVVNGATKICVEMAESLLKTNEDME